MDFALSTFTVEVNQTPILVFQAKWASEAENIGFGWAEGHPNQTLDEKTAYEAEGANVDVYVGVKIVYLIDLSSLS